MKRHLLVGASVLSWLGTPGVASADLPAWCGKASFETSSSDLYALKRSDADSVVRALAKTRCSTTPEVAQSHAKIDAARQAWGKKLGMIEADWADAVEFIDNRDGNFPKIELSTKLLAELTPMDQYRAIREGLSAGGSEAGALYLADAFDARLTEVGRLAFVEGCLKERIDSDTAIEWAVCQADLDAWDPAKFAIQLRSDTAHDGGTKMLLRLRVLELPERIKEYTAARDKLFRTDPEFKRMYDVAKKARTAWASTLGTNTKLLDLVLAMDSATLAGSRKQFAGCDAKTTAALVAAVATIPAKAFAGMSDIRDNPYEGFAHHAGPVLVNTPIVNLAANAYAQCHRTTGAGDFLLSALGQVPGMRGPRSAALTALLNEKFEFDDVNARPPRFPRPSDGRPYIRTGGTIGSAGGVVSKVKPGKTFATVSLQKTTAKRTDCVKSRRTNRVTRIRTDGSLEYESICLKSAVVTYDTTWTDFKINPAHAGLLKKGVVFSSISRDQVADVVAIWPSKTATVPSIVLGAKLK